MFRKRRYADPQTSLPPSIDILNRASSSLYREAAYAAQNLADILYRTHQRDESIDESEKSRLRANHYKYLRLALCALEKAVAMTRGLDILPPRGPVKKHHVDSVIKGMVSRCMLSEILLKHGVLKKEAVTIQELVFWNMRMAGKLQRELSRSQYAMFMSQSLIILAQTQFRVGQLNASRASFARSREILLGAEQAALPGVSTSSLTPTLMSIPVVQRQGGPHLVSKFIEDILKEESSPFVTSFLLSWKLHISFKTSSMPSQRADMYALFKDMANSSWPDASGLYIFLLYMLGAAYFGEADLISLREIYQTFSAQVDKISVTDDFASDSGIIYRKLQSTSGHISLTQDNTKSLTLIQAPHALIDVFSRFLGAYIYREPCLKLGRDELFLSEGTSLLLFYQEIATHMRDTAISIRSCSDALAAFDIVSKFLSVEGAVQRCRGDAFKYEDLVVCLRRARRMLHLSSYELRTYILRALLLKCFVYQLADTHNDARPLVECYKFVVHAAQIPTEPLFTTLVQLDARPDGIVRYLKKNPDSVSFPKSRKIDDIQLLAQASAALVIYAQDISSFEAHSRRFEQLLEMYPDSVHFPAFMCFENICNMLRAGDPDAFVNSFLVFKRTLRFLPAYFRIYGCILASALWDNIENHASSISHCDTFLRRVGYVDSSRHPFAPMFAWIRRMKSLEA